MKTLSFSLPVQLILLVILVEFASSVALGALALDYQDLTYFDLNLMAVQMEKNDRYKDAIDLLNVAISIKPQYPEAYIKRGSIYGLLHHKDMAIEDENKALSLISSNRLMDKEYKAMVHKSLAGMYMNYCENKSAEKELRTALQLCPSHPDTKEKLACLLAQRKDFRGALRYLHEAKEFYKSINAQTESDRVQEKILDLKNANLEGSLIGCSLTQPSTNIIK